MNHYFVIKQALEAFKTIKTNKWYIALPVLIDFLFIMSVGAAYALVGKRVILGLAEIASLSDSSASIQFLLDPLSVQALQGYAQIQAIRSSVFYWLIAFVAVFYVCWVIFNSINWYVSKRLLNEDISYLSYLKHFLIVNLIVFVIVSIILFLVVKLTFMYVFPSPIFQLLILIVAGILLAIVFYYTPLYYARCRKNFGHNTLKFGIRNFPRIILMYIVIILIFAAIQYFMTLMDSLHFIAFFASGIVLLLPAITWARIYINLVVEELENIKGN